MTAARRHGTEECRAIFARLSEYLDQEPDADLCERIDEHLADCAPCEAFLASLRRTVDLLGDVEPVELPASVRQEILDRIGRLRD
jgi:predicted anti-sigma-YlaC factor YlaD